MKIFVPHGPASALIEEVGGEIVRQTEASILSQLNELISRGLLIVESHGPIFVQDHLSAKLLVKTSVVLKLKDKEYIESLERQNTELRELISKLREEKPL